MDFDEYIRDAEPGKRERGINWATAIGLQAVDGLKPSDYLLETARRNIEGEISIKEAGALIDSYYKSKTNRGEVEDRTEEADKVSQRIADILSENSFSLTLSEYVNIHRRIFGGVFKHAGMVRDYNISKNEWVLDGESVMYSPWEIIAESIKHDLNEERKFDYHALPIEDAVLRLSRFIANLWQIHAFGEGNTRTTAVFLIKYLRSFGFEIANDVFRDNAWYFRNALVRANYNNLPKGITETYTGLEKFLRNLLMHEHNALRNRDLHIRATTQKAGTAQKTTQKNSTTQKTDIGLTMIQSAMLDLLRAHPTISRRELSERISNCTADGIKYNLKVLQDKGLLIRIGAARGGHWEVVG